MPPRPFRPQSNLAPTGPSGGTSTWLSWFHRVGVGVAEARKVLGLAQACPGRSRVILELEAQGWETLR